MKYSEFFGMILFAVQLKRLFGCKAFNKGQSIRVIGTNEKGHRIYNPLQPGLLFGPQVLLPEFYPLFLAAV
jgi:hypothetical protein